MSLKKLIAFVSMFYVSSIICEIPEPFKSIKVLPVDMHGWMAPENKRNLEYFILKLNPKIVIEIGSWLGQSAIFMASRLNAGARLYAIDTWLGSVEHHEIEEYKIKLPTLYHQFLSNCKAFNLSELIIPIRMASMDAVKALELQADLIYIDASHKEEDVYNDIIHWYQKLHPNGIMCGDDWYFNEVCIAVKRASVELGLNVNVEGNFWFFSQK